MCFYLFWVFFKDLRDYINSVKHTFVQKTCIKLKNAQNTIIVLYKHVSLININEKRSEKKVLLKEIDAKRFIYLKNVSKTTKFNITQNVYMIKYINVIMTLKK